MNVNCVANIELNMNSIITDIKNDRVAESKPITQAIDRTINWMQTFSQHHHHHQVRQHQ